MFLKSLTIRCFLWSVTETAISADRLSQAISFTIIFFVFSSKDLFKACQITVHNFFAEIAGVELVERFITKVLHNFLS